MYTSVFEAERPDGHPLNTISNADLIRAAAAMHLNSFNSGVFPTISLINHSCRPNCVKFEPNAVGVSEVRVVRPIAAGEECTICYLSFAAGLPCRSVRRALLRAGVCLTVRAILSDLVPQLEALRVARRLRWHVFVTVAALFASGGGAPAAALQLAAEQTPADAAAAAVGSAADGKQQQTEQQEPKQLQEGSGSQQAQQGAAAVDGGH